MGKLYNEKSIESLSPLAFTRLRPQVYCGDTTYSTQLLVEIVSNAVDEYRSGHGDKIEVVINKDIISVRDYGQGFIPNSVREDGKTVLEAAFSVLNTSGKYREDGAYEGTSLGSFGIGSKLANYLSHYLDVVTYRDGSGEYIHFEEGVFSLRKKLPQGKNLTGTKVIWQPSEEFFTNVEVEIDKVKTLFKTISCLCQGLTIDLDYNGEKIIYYSKNGLSDLLDEAVEGKEILKNRFLMNYANGKNKLDIIFTYTKNYSSTIVPYVNIGLTEKGPHITQIKTIITREFNKFFREKKWLKEKEDNLTGDDIQEGLYVVFNITAPNVAYNAQVKSTVTKIDMTPFNGALSEAIRIWCEKNEKALKGLAEKALTARKAREAAKKVKTQIRGIKENKSKGLKAKMALSDKFIDCVSKKSSERNLLLVEGQSAAGSAIEARNVQTDCIYMLRGKIISPLKQTLDKILANQEISDIIKVIGAGFGKEFDVSKANFNKIVITSDADSDGAAIELLLITFFFTYMRPLVEAGMLYRAVTPLYIVTTKNSREYCYTEEELNNWKKTHNDKYELTHCKGLGEINAATLKEICFEHQRYKRITVNDVKEAEKLLEILEGKNVEPRKQFIYDNATELGFNFM